MVILRPIYVKMRATAGGKAATYVYQPIFEIGEKQRYIKVCRKSPLLLDVVNLLLDRHHPKDRAATKKELADLARKALKSANQRIGANYVRNVAIVASDDPRYLGMKRPACN